MSLLEFIRCKTSVNGFKTPRFYSKLTEWQKSQKLTSIRKHAHFKNGHFCFNRTDWKL